MRRLLLPPVLLLVVAACKSSDTNTPPAGGDADAGPGTGSSPESDAGPDDASVDACHPGLPPSGFSTLAEGDNVGVNADLVLADGGAPVVAYTAPEADHLAIYLARWDTTCSTWGAPIKVDTTALHTGGTSRQVSLAYDASTGAVGVIYQVITAPLGQAHQYEVRFASLAKGSLSVAPPERVDDAAVNPDSDHGRSAPGLAMAGGNLYAAWHQAFRKCNVSGCDAIVHRSKTGGTWGAESVAPTTADVVASAQGTAVAVDSEGKPSIAFVARSFQTPVRGEVDYWRPGSATSSVALGANVGTDDPNVALAFAGTKPRLAAALHLTDTWASDGKTLWFVTSADGATWTPALPIPRDKGAGFGSFVALAVDGETRATVVADVNSGDGTADFGNPKIARTTDGTAFTIAGPPKSAFTGASKWLRAAVGADGKVSAVFFNPPGGGAVKTGFVFYRE